jgi:uncharacterized OB-fold protein
MTAPIVAAFREGLAKGELLLQKCTSCGRLNMYPRYACPFCQSERLTWQTSSGHGVLHSFTVLRAGAPEGFEMDLPYALGVVKLNEGVQLLGRLLPDAGGAWDSYACEQTVEFVASATMEPRHNLCVWFRGPAQT